MAAVPHGRRDVPTESVHRVRTTRSVGHRPTVTTDRVGAKRFKTVRGWTAVLPGSAAYRENVTNLILSFSPRGLMVRQ